jgi:hypothetical protein
MNVRESLKTQIATLVETKVRLTKKRRTYKLDTRGTVPEDERRSFFWSIDIKRANTKGEIRHHLLAYGYVRGRAYRCMEARVREGNKPSALAIEHILMGLDHDVEPGAIAEWLTVGQEGPQEAEEAA